MSRGSPHYVEGAQAPIETDAPLHAGVLTESERGHGIEPLLDGDAHLEFGEVEAETAVNSSAEPDVRVGRTVEVDGVGPVEDPLVAVGGVPQDLDRIAGADRDPS